MLLWSCFFRPTGRSFLDYAPFTAVSLNGTIGFDACISIFANRSRRSLRQRYQGALSRILIPYLRSTHFSMQLACSQDDMLSGLLLERLHARICLAEQLEATDELWHVRRVLRL